jgi:hypothetical protein
MVFNGGQDPEVPPCYQNPSITQSCGDQAAVAHRKNGKKPLTVKFDNWGIAS